MIIDMPGRLPSDLKEQISEKYYEMLEELREANSVRGVAGGGREGIGTEGMRSQVEKVCRILRTGGKQWQEKSADLAELFLEVVESGQFRNIAATEAAKIYIETALSYLVLKLDVIPDYDPIMGFVDDAVVLSLAADKVKEDDHELYNLLSEHLN